MKEIKRMKEYLYVCGDELVSVCQEGARLLVSYKRSRRYYQKDKYSQIHAGLKRSGFSLVKTTVY